MNMKLQTLKARPKQIRKPIKTKIGPYTPMTPRQMPGNKLHIYPKAAPKQGDQPSMANWRPVVGGFNYPKAAPKK